MSREPAPPQGSGSTSSQADTPDYFQLPEKVAQDAVPSLSPDHPWAQVISSHGQSQAILPLHTLGLPNKHLEERASTSKKPFPTSPGVLSLPNFKAPAFLPVPTPANDDRYRMITPETLYDLMRMRSPEGIVPPKHVLVLDIRPPTSFARCHIKGSVNVCAPTTLLRRPEFTIERIEDQILSSGTMDDNFRNWRTYTKENAPQSWIVVLDMDSTKTTSMGRSSAGGGGASLLGLLRKFESAGYKGQLCWVTGGFVSYSRWPPAADDIEWASTQKDSNHAISLVPTNTMKRPSLSLSMPSQGPMLALSDCMGNSAAHAANPFFDNIRQNLELSCGITDIVPLELSLSESQLNRLPRFLRDLAIMDDQIRAKYLAERFFEIEKGEQLRMQSVMQRHAFESSTNSSVHPPDVPISSRAVYPKSPTEHSVPPGAFPLSITAAIERGNDHRYRNFWTFEHSRVTLEKQPNQSRYINASFINPLRYMGGHDVYIATQAPLPSTFSVFWSVIWEYDIHTIVMLAREQEAGRIKCDNYWDKPTAEPFRVTVLERKTVSSKELQSFNKPTDAMDNAADVIVIQRTLQVCNLTEPDTPPRHITHYQYMAWPDHSVPDSPIDLLALKKRVDEKRSDHSDPIVVHCSAGIGRTGAYIMIDAVSSFLRHVRSSLACKGEHSVIPSRHECWDSPKDLIYEATMVMREQRMSMIETVRQYVFVYKAVIAALLADPVP
ncbi:unnamed protein product [Malassezia sympodialis ATCC 42132]|uniref:protein-tyrosine-phosphatase n=1 Tax=Malassezia sympodialis (strain ATCC 42132) TaxID=1230383 RepID=M5EDX4_MALS4|nr:uncharacterized protein MSY001_3283 [Malassezia sympodialis ATCC 42132]CCV00578.1 unnamed protein product [Malassezia sympodialis ATCC 42132]SHO79748.1 Similar to S.cerevisiae protein PTP1 (Phosphotyrosine-specific protein phosphatase) [Malassezia sympodialis ATCC 42132]|eukprot:XP_018741764.1 uncharacterized protein MSY001_3283 [Malassezia sympodialis ATCC 42132]